MTFSALCKLLYNIRRAHSNRNSETELKMKFHTCTEITEADTCHTSSIFLTEFSNYLLSFEKIANILQKLALDGGRDGSTALGSDVGDEVVDCHIVHALGFDYLAGVRTD